MIRFLTVCLTFTALSACAIGNGSGPSGEYVFQRRPGQGIYVPPANLLPQPMQRIPADDVCRSQFYRSLVGRHEGSIYFAALPGQKRVIKPAELEDPISDFLPDMEMLPPTVEIRDYLPEQSVYASSIRTLYGDALAGPEIRTRLTIELDDEGYVTRVACG